MSSGHPALRRSWRQVQVCAHRPEIEGLTTYVVAGVVLRHEGAEPSHVVLGDGATNASVD
jgi:hypothetical protein